MKDLHNSSKAVTAIEPVAIGTTGTGQSGNVIDRKGYHGVEFILSIGAVTATNAVFTPVIKEGDATGSMTSVADAKLIGTESGATLGAGTRVDGSTEKVTYKIGYTGNKRYVQCSVSSTITAGTPVSAVALLHGAEIQPDSTDQGPA